MKPCIKISLACLLFLPILIPFRSYAQSSERRLDSLFEALHKDGKFNGNVLIVQHGKILYQHAFGYADREEKLLNTLATRSHLASTSKLFAAVAILQLKEKGLIKLDDRVDQYLKDFPYPAITIRHLLTHTSGLPDFQIFEPYYKEDPNRILTHADLIPAIKKYGKLLFEPGEYWSYSSPGTALLAMILEKVTHLTYEQYLKKNIWNRAGMRHTYVNSLSSPVSDDNRVKNYAKTGIFSDSLQIAENIPRHREFAQLSGGLVGPGLIVSNTTDLFLFD